MKVVALKHPNVSGYFWFQVTADHYFFRPGVYVLCDTKKGNDQIGICVTNAFDMDDHLIPLLTGQNPENLKKVKSILIRHDLEEKVHEDKHEDGQQE